MKPQAMLNYLLGTNEGLVLYSIYSDCANKLQGDDTWKEFDINQYGYVSKSYNSITDFTGVRIETVRRVISRLIKNGLLQKKPGNIETNNIPYYRPEYRSSVFIELAKERLADKRNGLNKNQDERFIPEIISTFENNSCVLVALGLIKFPEELKSSEELKSPEERDEVIKYVSVLQHKWGEKCE